VADRLAARERHTADAPAAVLDHRVGAQLRNSGVDAAPYHQPPPRTRHQDWQHLTHLLHAAHINYLAGRPTAELAAEHHNLTHHPPDHPDLTARLHLITAALARQIDLAAVQLTIQPATYLTALLGNRPSDAAAVSTWDAQATAIEHYRHFVRLPYGTPAGPGTAPPAIQALGAQPENPVDHVRYESLQALQSTLDLGLGV
jgi:hypothetical protein